MGHLHPGAQTAIHLIVQGLSVAALFVGWRRHQPARGTAWGWLTAGFTLWWASYTLRADVLLANVLPVSLASTDAATVVLCGYGLIIVALWQMMYHRCRGIRLISSLDGSILYLGLSLLAWVITRSALQAAVRSSTEAGGRLEALSGLIFVFCGIMIATSTWSMLTTPGARTPAFRFMVYAVLVQLIGHTAAAITAHNAASASAPVTSALTAWSAQASPILLLSAHVLWGAAALHPSMRSLTTAPLPAASTGLSRARVAALLTGLLTIPAASLVQARTGQHLDAVIVSASVTLVVLTVIRMALALNATVTLLRTTEELHDEMTHQATHDHLTGLANRAHARIRLDAALSSAQNSARRQEQADANTGGIGDSGGAGTGVGVLFVDLDGFKTVNDTLGHAAGDAVLREVAHRLATLTGAADCAARHGGDEFILIAASLPTITELTHRAQQVLALFETPIIWEGHHLEVGASIGAAFSPDGALGATALLKDADRAAYRAKADGRGRVRLFDEAARREAERQAEVEEGLRHALQGDQRLGGQLELHYQPVVDLTTGTPQGWEALIRWRRPDGHLAPPDSFIPIAECSDLICDLGRWVLDTACAQLATWTTHPAASTAHIAEHIAVNISARHLMQPRVVDDVLFALRSAGAPAHLLTIEVTETVLIASPVVDEHLHQLRKHGVRVAIDDFGTGYTSISQFQHLPADIVKIDRSLTASEHPQTAALLDLIVRAAHAYGLAVIAEGIETPEQHHALRRAGAQFGQGWLFGRPHPAAAIISTAADHTSSAIR